MKGQNRPRGIEHGEGQLQVTEIFRTIQGEGPHAGRTAVFVRLTGCNLRCWFCDTAWDDERDQYMSVDAIVGEVLHVATSISDIVVLTGGEPCRQNIDNLVQQLVGWGLHVQIETAGSFWRECMRWPEVSVVVSPKVAKVHPGVAGRADAFKYVVGEGDADPKDGLPCHPMQGPRIGLIGSGGGKPARPPKSVEPWQIYIQPRDDGDGEQNKANMDYAVGVCLKHGYRLSLQQHKIIGLP